MIKINLKPESRWRRPSLYLTIVSVYLLANAAYSIYNTALEYDATIITYKSFQTFWLSQYPHLYWAIFWAVTSISGAILLLSRNKSGLLVSFFGLIISMGSILTTYFFALDTTNYNSYLITHYSEVAICGSMFVLLVLGSRRTQPKEIMSNKVHLWQRPRLYTTIVAIYLILIASVILLLVTYFLYDMSENAAECAKRYCGNMGMGIGFVFFAIWVGVIVVPPPLIGGILLLMGKRIGRYLALISLSMQALVIGWVVAGNLFSRMNPFLPSTWSDNLGIYPIFLFLFFSLVVLFPLFIKGWRQTRQVSDKLSGFN